MKTVALLSCLFANADALRDNNEGKAPLNQPIRFASYNLLMNSLAKYSNPSAWENSDEVKIALDDHLAENPVACVGIVARGPESWHLVEAGRFSDNKKLQQEGLVRCVDAVFTEFFHACPWSGALASQVCRKAWAEDVDYILYDADGISESAVMANQATPAVYDHAEFGRFLLGQTISTQVLLEWLLLQTMRWGGLHS